MIALDYIPNYDFVTCQDWIEWINQQEITLGQPCVKEDKRSRLMPLDSRVKCVCLVQPANARFNPDIRRLYLPRSAEQFMSFLMCNNIYVQINLCNDGYELRSAPNLPVLVNHDIMKVFGKLIVQLKQAKRVK